MFTHTTVGADDLDVSGCFDDVVLAPLGIKRAGRAGERGLLYLGAEPGGFLVLRPLDGAATRGNGITIGFKAPDRAAVDAFHRAGISAGGADAGAPRLLPSGAAQTYGAYLLDPVGNKISPFTAPETDFA
jgi:hypothetical protein